MTQQKKRGKKRGEPGAVAVAPTAEETGPVLPARTAVPVTSVPKVSSENLRELLHKLSVDERTKPHQFWDTQPVPKLGLTSHLFQLPLHIADMLADISASLATMPGCATISDFALLQENTVSALKLLIA